MAKRSAIKPLTTPKSSFRSRILVVFCIFVPMVMAMIMTTSDKALPARNRVWNVRIKGLPPEIQSLLILDSRVPNIRITALKVKDTDYAEVQMNVRSHIISNFLFSAATPDFSGVSATTRDAENHEQLHGFVVLNASEPKAEVRLGPYIEPDKQDSPDGRRGTVEGQRTDTP